MSPLALAVVSPSDQEYEYGDVPPLTVDEALPLLPKQIIFAVVLAETLMAVAWVRVAVAELVHPLLSVIFTLYVPALNPVAEAVVWLFASLHT